MATVSGDPLSNFTVVRSMFAVAPFG
ncbi:hypothetical protein FP2506_17634 [Fulvimarina pelagi HTCC2506]|uniref:Uncharacterized protein n=1 Tax=Fulvimarina pelagi HTCC2506 TaxID=314231 RepID=Q0FY21_9HYPH|nr:hypothetical protein FP2506_17634 [Fulvimarina pelagi HTCC2506]